MHFLKYLPLAILPTTLALPPVVKISPNTITVERVLGIISENVVDLTKIVSAFDGNFIDALKIHSTITFLQDAVNQTTSSAKDSAPFNEDESNSIGQAIINLQPEVNNLLDEFQKNKKAFDSGFVPLSQSIRINLKQGRQATLELGDTIVAKLTTNYAAYVPQAIRKMRDKFDETIVVYIPEYIR